MSGFRFPVLLLAVLVVAASAAAADEIPRWRRAEVAGYVFTIDETGAIDLLPEMGTDNKMVVEGDRLLYILKTSGKTLVHNPTGGWTQVVDSSPGTQYIQFWEGKLRIDKANGQQWTYDPWSKQLKGDPWASSPQSPRVDATRRSRRRNAFAQLHRDH